MRGDQGIAQRRQAQFRQQGWRQQLQFSGRRQPAQRFGNQFGERLRTNAFDRRIDRIQPITQFALIAFGGAGPMHAARLADELEIERVLCPRAAGVLSAVGLIAAPQRRDLARSVLLGEREIEAGHGTAAVRELAADAARQLPGARIEASYDLRYRGQAFELTVEGPEDADAAALRSAFEGTHEERYGYTDPEAELELVNVRVAAVGERRPPAVTAPAEAGTLAPGDRVPGPAVCRLPETTVVVPAGWHGTVDPHGTLVLERR